MSGVTFLAGGDRALAEAISRLAYCNPFLPERIECERAALGPAFVAGGTLWHATGEPDPMPNVAALGKLSEALAGRLAARLTEGVRPSAEDLQLYEDVVVYLLFSRYEEELYRLLDDRRVATAPVGFYRKFRQDVERFLQIPRATLLADRDVPHLLASYFQIRRAFHHIFRNIIGNSASIVRLRAAVWQSIFTRDMRRYRRSLYQRLGDIATLICGPSGTGKELVAHAIGLARYIPFDPERQAFAEDAAGAFYTLNPSALSPTLIESELFGHRRGAFTGAVQDRTGWLEVCPPLGAVFLDEIGELDTAAQAEGLAQETEGWIGARLGAGYGWPGNVRELEQCVRNVMIRGEYRPPRAGNPSARRRIADEVMVGTLSAEEVLRRYCTLVYADTGSYQETGRRLGLDRRTVREKVDPTLLDELRRDS